MSDDKAKEEQMTPFEKMEEEASVARNIMENHGQELRNRLQKLAEDTRKRVQDQVAQTMASVSRGTLLNLTGFGGNMMPKAEDLIKEAVKRADKTETDNLDPIAKMFGMDREVIQDDPGIIVQQAIKASELEDEDEEIFLSAPGEGNRRERRRAERKAFNKLVERVTDLEKRLDLLEENEKEEV